MNYFDLMKMEKYFWNLFFNNLQKIYQKPFSLNLNYPQKNKINPLTCNMKKYSISSDTYS